MSGLVCAKPLAVAILQLLILTATSAFAQSSDGLPRELYQSASAHLANGDYRRAIPALSQLVQRFPEHELTNVARFHLAECFTASGSFETALQVLATYKPQSEAQAQKAALIRLTATQGIVSQSLKSKQFVTALKLLEQSLNGTDNPKHHNALARLFVRVGLLHVRSEYAAGNAIESSIRQIPARHPNAASHLDEIRFGFAETLYAQGQRGEASKIYDSLAASNREQVSNARSSTDWLATVALRRATLAMHSRNRELAKQITSSAMQQFASFPHVHEFAFIQSQCSIADLRFDEALNVLGQVASKPTSTPETRRRAVWMTGEVFFLQKNLQEAISAYEQVSNLSKEAPSCIWNLRAMIQKAKCLELSGMQAEAIQLYELVANEFDACEETKFASSRIATLTEPQETLIR